MVDEPSFIGEDYLSVWNEKHEQTRDELIELMIKANSPFTPAQLNALTAWIVSDDADINKGEN